MPNKPEDFSQLSDEQLLVTLLRSDKKASEILMQMSIERIVEAHRFELGLTPKAYDRLQASIELGRRINESRMQYQTTTKIKSSADAIEYCRNHFRRLITDGLQEEFHIITLNTKNHVLRSHRITVGTLDASLVHPREVFRPAIKDSASSIILSHNHPSGDPTPSREDIDVTRRLTDCGNTIGIDVLDHIVLGKKRSLSVFLCNG